MGSKAQPDLIIVGASARAAVFSAARAGFLPYWVDQFGDADLESAFPGRRVEPAHYPAGLVTSMESAPDAPWLYTGALENHLEAMQSLQSLRRLAGNAAGVCRQVRDPWRLRDCLLQAGLAYPDLAAAGESAMPRGKWLAKPLHSTGGLGIVPAMPGSAAPRGHYIQRFVAGENRSAVFIGDGRGAELAGVTEQMIGRTEFHAGPFCYCGSIGPLQPGAEELAQWQRTGSTLVREFGLRGLFGVDAVISEGRVLVVEVNPRYTASIEVLELATGIGLVRCHLEACDGKLPVFNSTATTQMVGKAYLFAPRDLRVRQDDFIHADRSGGEFPRFADIPRPGTAIRAGAPILTVLVRGGDVESCARLLAEQARDVYSSLSEEQ